MSVPKKSKSKTKIKDEFVWWLTKGRPFILDDEYKIELEFIGLTPDNFKKGDVPREPQYMSARIKITKLKDEEENNGLSKK